VGTHVAFAVAAALACRERGGPAQHVEVPMFETFTDLVAGDHLGGLSFEPPEGDPHYPRLLSEYRRPYRTRDGWIAMLLYTEAHWRRFFRLIGREEEFDGDPRLSDRSARIADIDVAYGRVAEALGARSTDEWLDDLVPLDIPVAPVHDVAALLQDPHLDAVGFWREIPLPDGRTLRTTAPVGCWSETEPGPLRPPPIEPEDARLADWGAQP
jgi:crotonobetainyl-CoA:carnitine CoA-transferase CaiB-like acyl-CoA transferase